MVALVPRCGKFCLTSRSAVLVRGAVPFFQPCSGEHPLCFCVFVGGLEGLFLGAEDVCRGSASVHDSSADGTHVLCAREFFVAVGHAQYQPSTQGAVPPSISAA